MSMTPISPLDRTSPSFKNDVDKLFAEQLPTFTEEAAELALRLGEAETALAAAQEAASSAQLAAEAAALTAGAMLWVPGSFVAKGASVIGLVDAHTYRKLTDGATLLDPSEDSGNWFDLTSANKRDAELALLAANTARAGAEAARDAANAVGKVFATTAAGIAGSTNGQSFCVLSSDSTQLIVYRNSSGTAAEVTRYYTKAYMDTVLGKAEGISVPAMAMVDADNFAFFVAQADGSFGTTKAHVGAQIVATENFSFESNDSVGLALVDDEGFVSFQVEHDGSSFKARGATNNIDARNSTNLAMSVMARTDFNSEVQRPVCKYNHFLTVGQSLSTATEGWPALSKVQRYDNLMFGDSVRPNSGGWSGFIPLGSATLNSMKAVVQNSTGQAILTDAEVAALAPGSGNEGESIDVGAVNHARKLFLQQFGLASDPNRLFVASNCGVSGRTIEALSKGANPELYLRPVQAAQGVKNIATAQAATYCVPAIFFAQGEWNYVTTYGGDVTKAGYKAALKKYRNDLVTDICVEIAGQSAPPAFITYQTGGSYTRDENDLAVGQAQLELSQEERNWYLATPVYPYTDKGGHLDSNGYRWMGMQMGKVFHRVVTLGQDWKPLSPRNITVGGREVLIDFHVPYPPLAFDRPYVSLGTVDYPAKGFKVTDDSGAVSIQAVEIAADTIVRIVLARAAVGDVKVQYADKSVHNGNGNLRDSDPALASENYEYTEGSGQYSGANIAALVGKPYPLHNWCVAFSFNATAI